MAFRTCFLWRYSSPRSLLRLAKDGGETVGESLGSLSRRIPQTESRIPHLSLRRKEKRSCGHSVVRSGKESYSALYLALKPSINVQPSDDCAGFMHYKRCVKSCLDVRSVSEQSLEVPDTSCRCGSINQARERLFGLLERTQSAASDSGLVQVIVSESIFRAIEGQASARGRSIEALR